MGGGGGGGGEEERRRGAGGRASKSGRLGFDDDSLSRSAALVSHRLLTELSVASSGTKRSSSSGSQLSISSAVQSPSASAAFACIHSVTLSCCGGGGGGSGFVPATGNGGIAAAGAAVGAALSMRRLNPPGDADAGVTLLSAEGTDAGAVASSVEDRSDAGGALLSAEVVEPGAGFFDGLNNFQRPIGGVLVLVATLRSGWRVGSWPPRNECAVDSTVDGGGGCSVADVLGHDPALSGRRYVCVTWPCVRVRMLSIRTRRARCARASQK